MNHWGRIFFIYGPEPGAGLRQVFGQPLANHVDNCKALLDRFHPRYFCAATRDRLLHAVQWHDEGKKETFRIRFDAAAQRLAYSFAGHRFRVSGGDPYVAGLIRSHHEFSVEQVNRARAQLPPQERQVFADDLYLLCMADQLEAELAVKTVENKQDVARTFMEFKTERTAGREPAYRVVPWPFEADSFAVTFHLKELAGQAFQGKSPAEIETALKQCRDFRETLLEVRVQRQPAKERR